SDIRRDDAGDVGDTVLKSNPFPRRFGTGERLADRIDRRRPETEGDPGEQETRDRHLPVAEGGPAEPEGRQQDVAEDEGPPNEVSAGAGSDPAIGEPPGCKA